MPGPPDLVDPPMEPLNHDNTVVNAVVISVHPDPLNHDNAVEQPAAADTRMTPGGSGLLVTPVKPKCSPPINPLSFPANDWDRDAQPTALPMPKTEKVGAAPLTPKGKEDEWQIYPEGDDPLLKELFPDPGNGRPFELQEALRAMYIKQDHIERRFEHWLTHIMEHLQQRLASEISDQLNSNGVRPWQFRGRRASDRNRSPNPSSRLNSVRRRSAATPGRRSQFKPVSSSGSQSVSVVKPAEPIVPQERPESYYDGGADPGLSIVAVKSSERDSSPETSGRRNTIQGDLNMLAEQIDKYKDPAAKRHQKKEKHEAKKRQKMSRRGAKSTKSRAGGSGEPDEETILSQVVHHPLFDMLCAAMILLNSVLIGITVEYTTKNPDEAGWMMICSHFCNAFFLVELIMRMSNQGIMYFTSDERTWNIFDFVLVAFSLVDVIMMAVGETASSVGSGMKTIKMLRIVRIFRVFRFFRELSLLALMIADSIKSLMWALLMLTIIIYVFAICFTQSCSDYLKQHANGELETPPSPKILNDIIDQFGSLPKTIYFLILSMLSGISWGEVSDTLMQVDSFSAFLFFFYIFFTLLAVLNIITGVFVDNAVETARTQRDFLAQKELELREKYVAEMRELFHEMDEDGSGTVSWEEMDDHFSDARVRGYFAALGIDPDDMSRLFQLIDDDRSGEVEVDEFLDGCLRLKGEAKSIDVHTVLHECRKMHNRLEDLLVACGCEPENGKDCPDPAASAATAVTADGKHVGSPTSAESKLLGSM